MTCNVGTVDETIRIIIAIIIVLIAYRYSLWWVYIIAGILFLTGSMGYCHIYSLFGINTCKK